MKSLLFKKSLLEMFYAIWTSKEAVAKAFGVGLGLKFPSVCVFDGKRARESRLDVGEGRYSLCDLKVSEGYAAAVACEGNLLEIRQYDFWVDRGALLSC